MRIELHPAAEAEAREAFHYRAADPSVASRFMAALDSAIAEPSHSRPVKMSAKEHLDLSRGRNARLLARRISRSEIETGRAYVIHARNGGVGVAVEEDGVLGYRLHRVKFGQHYLFVEYDYEDDDTFGTAIPLAFISESHRMTKRLSSTGCASRSSQTKPQLAPRGRQFSVLTCLGCPNRRPS